MPVSTTANRSRACGRRSAQRRTSRTERTAIGELDRVAGEVQQHLLQVHRIAVQRVGDIGGDQRHVVDALGPADGSSTSPIPSTSSRNENRPVRT